MLEIGRYAVLTTPDGERLHAWWMQTKGAKRTVLYFQGNGTNVSHKIPRLKTFRKMGINALLIDYRGYGKSTGRVKNEVDIYTDGLTAWNFLTAEKGIDPEDIIIWGRSLGGGVAAEIARFKDIAALVLESTFYSLDEIVKRQYWFLPTTWLLNFHFENGRKLKQVTAPVVIIHSLEDDYIIGETQWNLSPVVEQSRKVDGFYWAPSLTPCYRSPEPDVRNARWIQSWPVD